MYCSHSRSNLSRSRLSRYSAGADGKASTSRADTSQDVTFFLTPSCMPLSMPSDDCASYSTTSTSTPCNSAMRAPIQELTSGSRISEAVKAVESKYSSTRPFSNVP